ncbi:LysR substrate-binding domain-containing protein [Paraburkholderia sp. Cy-641]|uniref:LysR substrate-binding domain-containing protein n=1 Tax=Paraburkholderia sp. Cy-641 TaxID=2608337 RepID=UPI0031F5C19A
MHAGHLEMLPYRDDRLVLVTSRDRPLAKRASADFSQVLSANFVSLPMSSAIHAFIMSAADALGARLKLRIRARTDSRSPPRIGPLKFPFGNIAMCG